MSYRVGVDVGGTFTDLMFFDDERRRVALEKVQSSPPDWAAGIVNGLKKLCERADVTPEEVDFFIHGTTVATNAILEGKGAKSAVIVTKGFRDVLHIMRQDRPKLYDFFARRAEALVPRDLRFEVNERVLYTGEVLTQLDEKKLRGIAREIRRRGIKTLAVCFLHSYANPAHELAARRILLAECPELAVSLSCEILPEMKEYERMSTTTINACVAPIVGKYLQELKERLEQAGMNKTVHIMQSNGGIMPSSMAAQKSAHTVLSGPAAGVIGGLAIAKQAGYRNVITVDMGGTSFDICLAYQGNVTFTRATELGGHALCIPMIDIHTIGAGGGSIAWIDAGGALKVGPQSAGANPGPACYGRGGKLPTVTDANLTMMRLNPDYFLGGELTVDAEASRKVIERELAKPLGLDVMQTAEGVTRVVNAGMVRGIRYVSIERGYDPREFAMVCFGGNGPLHGAELAEELGIPEVIVPFAPGVNCAYGLLMADFRHDMVRTFHKKTSLARPAEMEAHYRKLEETAAKKLMADGVPQEDIVAYRSLDMRYLGQGYEIEAPVPPGKLDAKKLAEVTKRFHALHKLKYGFSREGETTEMTNLRVTVAGLTQKPALPKERLTGSDPSKALKARRLIFLRGKQVKASIYDRARLQPGNKIRGPAVIEQKDSTTLLFKGHTARIDAYRNIIISVKGSK